MKMRLLTIYITQLKMSGKSIAVSILLQASGIFITGLFMDGGLLAITFLVNVIAWWIAFFLIMLRRAGNLTEADENYIKFGVIFNYFILSPMIFFAINSLQMVL